MGMQIRQIGRAAPRRRIAAFTLVELLVVIGIIAILITILLPVLNKAREYSRSIVCQSNERQLLMAVAMYAGENKGATPIFPPIQGIYPGTDGPTRSLAYYMDVAGLVRFDVGPFWKYVSASSRIPNAPVGSSPTGEALWRVMNCPSDLPPRQGFSPDRNFSYSWNARLWNISGYGFGPIMDPAGEPPVSRMVHIRQPANKIILEEEVAPNDGWSVIGIGGGNPADTPSYRHVGRGNWGFADGHVESLYPNDLGYVTVPNSTVTSTPTYPTAAAGAATVDRYFHLQSRGL